MSKIQRTLSPLLFPLLSFTLLLGCDKKPEEGKKDDKKSAEKKDDKKAAEPAPEPEAPKGPMFTAEGVMGDDVSIPIVPFDLAAAELPGYTIQVPEGTRAEDKSTSGKKLLNTKVNYSMTVAEGPFDIEQAKKIYGILDAEGKVTDEAEDHIIYQRSGEGGFLFQAGVTVGDKQFNCGTVAGVMPFTRRQIDQTVASCKSIAAAEGGAAPAAEGGAAPAAEGGEAPPAAKAE